MRRAFPHVLILLAMAGPSFAQSSPQSAPPGTGDAASNPQQDISGEPTSRSGIGITYGGELDSKVQLDGNFPRGNKGYAELYAKSIASAYVNIGRNFAVRGEATYERFRAQSATTAFNGQGLYLSQLYGIYSSGFVTVYAGKIHPRFSVGYGLAPGIYETFANDYEQKERIGAGLLVNVAPAYGRHLLSAEAYFLDTSVLSRSLFARPNFGDPAALRPYRFRRSQGGAGNTGGFDSYDVALDGSRIPGLERLSYHLGFTQQGVSQPGERKETGYAAALSYEFRLSSRVFLTPLVEYAHFNNFNGAAGEVRDYVIAAAEFDYRRWALALVAAPRRVQSPEAKARWDHQLSTTLSYRVRPRFFVSVGYNRIQDNGQTTDAVGTAVNYVLRF